MFEWFRYNFLVKFFSFLLCFVLSGRVLASVVINEVMQSNVDVIMDDLNQFPDSWIELYNDDSVAVDITDYSVGLSRQFVESFPLSDSVVIDSAGHYLIYCDKESQHNHTDFRLETEDACTIYLFDRAEQIVDSLVVPALDVPNVAYGRVHDADSLWAYFRIPTPGTPNIGVTSSVFLAKPNVSVKGGIFPYDTTLYVAVSLPKSAPVNTVIRYTLNGSEPTEQSSLAPDTIVIQTSTVLKLKTFNDSAISKPSKVNSYIFLDRKQTLPIIALTIDSLYLWDDEIGIYTTGTYHENHPDVLSDVGGVPTVYQENYYYNWRRPTNFEYFVLDDDEAVVNQLCESRIAGNVNRYHDVKAMSLYANKRFGTKRFSYKFWENKDIQKVKSIRFRNAGEEYSATYFRDALSQCSFGRKINLDYSEYQPAVLFINGEYFGMLNVREQTNEDYVWQNYDKLEDIDMTDWANTGNIASWDSLMAMVVDSVSGYKDFDSVVDMSEFLDFMVATCLYANVDFPANNMVAWRNRSNGGKWRWLMHDFDSALGLQYAYDYNYLDYLLEERDSVDRSRCTYNEYSSLIYKRLMKFPENINRFVDRSSVYMATFLNVENGKKMIDDFMSNISTEFRIFEEKQNRAVFGTWDQATEYLALWYENRIPYFYSHMSRYWSLGDTVSAVIEGKNDIYVNNVKLDGNRYDGLYFKNRHLVVSHRDSSFVYDADSIVFAYDMVDSLALQPINKDSLNADTLSLAIDSVAADSSTVAYVDSVHNHLMKGFALSVPMQLADSIVADSVAKWSVQYAVGDTVYTTLYCDEILKIVVPDSVSSVYITDSVIHTVKSELAENVELDSAKSDTVYIDTTISNSQIVDSLSTDSSASDVTEDAEKSDIYSSSEVETKVVDVASDRGGAYTYALFNTYGILIDAGTDYDKILSKINRNGIYILQISMPDTNRRTSKMIIYSR